MFGYIPLAMGFSRTRGRHARTYGQMDTDSSSNERDAASIYICQCQPTLKTLAQCDSTNSKLAIATREIEKTLGGQRSIPVSGWSDRKPRRRRHRMGQLSRRALLCPARVSTVLLAVETRTHFLSITCWSNIFFLYAQKKRWISVRHVDIYVWCTRRQQ
jgi:hypothetical protein